MIFLYIVIIVVLMVVSYGFAYNEGWEDSEENYTKNLRILDLEYIVTPLRNCKINSKAIKETLARVEELEDE
jgi:hypothetical protein